MQDYDTGQIAQAKLLQQNAAAIVASVDSAIKKSIFEPSAYLASGAYVDARAISFILINGCGGTGGWFIPKLGKILKDAAQKNMLADKVTLLFCDGDTVANKNIIRQNFIERDIGQNKAKVFATRYSILFPDCVEVAYVDKYVSNEGIIKTYPEVLRNKFVDIATLPMFQREGFRNDPTFLILNFVDNAISRRIIHVGAMRGVSGTNSSAIVVDAGNNAYNGQVSTSLYFSNSHYSRNHFTSNPYAYYARNPEEVFDNEFVKLENCADADLAANNPDQLFNANDMSATITANLINTLFAENRVHYALTKFVTGKNITVENSLPYGYVKIGTAYHPSEMINFNNFSETLLHTLTNSNSRNLYIGNHINVNDRIMRDSYYYAFRNSRISELQISNIARSIGEFYTQTKECLFRNTVDHTVASECIRSGYNITNKIIKFDDYINAKKESELLKKAA